MKVLHLITGMNAGGAEGMLLKLSREWKGKGHEMEVISMTSGGVMADAFRREGIPLIELNMHPGEIGIHGLIKLMAHVERSQAKILQTWMYHADAMGAAAKILGMRLPLIWNLRHGDPNDGNLKLSTKVVARVCATISRAIPDRVFCCSRDGADRHSRIGYWNEKIRVLPNGFDLIRYSRDEKARSQIRASLGIRDDATLFGQIARFHPVKAHRLMLEAFALLPGQVHLLLCGEGTSEDNGVLMGEISRLGIGARCHVVGKRSDVPAVVASLDVLVSPSFSEGFPNVVGEAMACEVPCIVTDVGDSVLAMGGNGWVVVPGDVKALAKAMEEAVSLGRSGRSEIGARGRVYIRENFSIERVAERYIEGYSELISEHQG